MMPFNPAEYALWLMPVALVLGLLTAFRRARRPGLIAQWAALSNGQRLTSIVIIAAFVGAIAIARRQHHPERTRGDSAPAVPHPGHGHS